MWTASKLTMQYHATKQRLKARIMHESRTMLYTVNSKHSSGSKISFLVPLLQTQTLSRVENRVFAPHRDCPHVFRWSEDWQYECYTPWFRGKESRRRTRRKEIKAMSVVFDICFFTHKNRSQEWRTTYDRWRSDIRSSLASRRVFSLHQTRRNTHFAVLHRRLEVQLIVNCKKSHCSPSERAFIT